jgi:glycine cleavage system aminomethyltransferase T
VSLAFLTAAADGIAARSPMERQARAAGARFALRDGWNVAVEYPGERQVLDTTVGWADASHLVKLELGGEPPLALDFGRATRTEDGWWLPMTRARTLLLDAQPAVRDKLEAVDVTTAFGALALAGPLARETFARFTALDLRPSKCPPGAWRPGSVARTPGGILCLAEDRFLLLFGTAYGQYMWTVVADAACRLGGGPVGADALAPVPEAVGAGA